MAVTTRYKTYNTEAKAGEDLVHYYRRLAKVADQRLVRLERLSQQKNYGNAKQWAYARAQRDIKAWTGEGSNRFNTKPPENVNQLKAKINDIKTFLESASSTKRGITEVYKKRADTINNKYGTNFSWQDMANYFRGGKAEKDAKKFGSKTALKIIAVVQRNKDAIVQAIKKNKEINIVTDPDDAVNKKGVVNIVDSGKLSKKALKNVNEFLKENNLRDLKELF